MLRCSFRRGFIINTPQDTSDKATGYDLPDQDHNIESKTSEKRHVLLLMLLIFVYSLLAFTNLGDVKAPESGWTPQLSGSTVYVDFEQQQDIQRITYLCGLGETWYNVTSLDLYFKDISGRYVKFETLEKGASKYGKWLYKDLETPVSTDSIKIVAVSYQDPEEKNIRGIRGEILEVCFFAQDEQTPIAIKEVRPSNPAMDENSVKLFDEQELFVYEPSYMNSSYFDEVYFPRTAYEFLINNETVYENTHPHLGKIIIMWSYKLFGVNPFAYRVMGALSGVLMIPIMYALAKLLFKKHYYALIAAALLSFDHMHFVQTRLGTVDGFLVLFILLSFYFMALFFTMDLRRERYIKALLYLLLSGAFFGMAVSTKWIGLYAGAGLALIYFIKIGMQFYHYRFQKGELGGVPRLLRNTLLTSILCIIFFIAVPAVIYFYTYTPIFNIQSLAIGGESFTISERISSIIASQKHMYSYHGGVDDIHPFQSPWYSWPIMYRPVYYYSAPITNPGQWGTIVAMGNPIIWWTGVGALIATAVLSIKNKDKRGLFILLGYASILLPWAVAPRSITFLYHYFACIPFIILAIVYIIEYMLQDNPTWRKYVNIYVFVCGLIFLAFYPALTGVKITVSYVELLRWLPSWWF